MSPVRVAALAVGLLGAVLVGVLATRQAGPDRVSMHLVGQVAPPIAGSTIDGEVWNLDDQRGRFVVVNFFSTTCVPCIREHPELVAFAEAHAEVDDVRIVSVAFDDNPSAVEAFFRENGGGWPVLAEETGRIAVDWGVIAVPESYLVSPSGHVVVKVVGGVEAEDLESVLVGAKRSTG
ncbi:MAG: TlpA disulfide reductase family protein [Acidimicrobiales bacterium]|jgi:cytochrome c biogenesis protein CcmG/thiol:disulfide interchange protein DsbE|nr:TlpA disulfide reductase family protein [Acidimicrobiales bacterium]MDP6280326.1 TlpA disulfide reductase family protein [Acidimicrobiales bacterium]MDP7117945.1 TlpA disulfide reductase family protein [Acidimicrobiales bacterium]MDP7410189.1 TlpA disulfide reductase family protein [Acidimicrobiales bacterium]MEE1521520.1 TlpA disulfide reductase family protein [Acidimicrobiales bacterium]|tara:strand:- start:20283 stop:20816 length:534 start_codon:yes stop_codon:yes gene_type:complete